MMLGVHGAWLLQWGVVIGASLFAAVVDVRMRRIPNRLTGPVLLGGLIWAAWRAGIPGLADATMAVVLLAVPFCLLFAFGGGGAGDAKLMGAIGAWLGVAHGVVALICVLLVGAVLGVVFAVVKGRGRDVLASIGRTVWSVLFVMARHTSWRDVALPRSGEMLRMPYGVAIFAGVCIAAGGVYLWHA